MTTEERLEAARRRFEDARRNWYAALEEYQLKYSPSSANALTAHEMSALEEASERFAAADREMIARGWELLAANEAHSSYAS